VNFAYKMAGQQIYLTLNPTLHPNVNPNNNMVSFGQLTKLQRLAGGGGESHTVHSCHTPSASDS